MMIGVARAMPIAFARRKTADAYSVPETFPQNFFGFVFFIVVVRVRLFQKIQDNMPTDSKRPPTDSS
jgi:hypothetical protein